VWGGGGICSIEMQVELQVEVENAGIMAPALPMAGHLPRAGRTRVHWQPARTGRAEDDTTVMGHCGTVTVMVSPAARATWHSESLRLAGGGVTAGAHYGTVTQARAGCHRHCARPGLGAAPALSEARPPPGPRAAAWGQVPLAVTQVRLLVGVCRFRVSVGVSRSKSFMPDFSPLLLSLSPDRDHGSARAVPGQCPRPPAIIALRLEGPGRSPANGARPGPEATGNLKFVALSPLGIQLELEVGE
jgi:hypothetical protein